MIYCDSVLLIYDQIGPVAIQGPLPPGTPGNGSRTGRSQIAPALEVDKGGSLVQKTATL
jgi:hypothetical protein